MRTHFSGRFYLSKQRRIRGPLQFQGRAQQRLDPVWLQGAATHPRLAFVRGM
jgi:hypothetical protein